MKTIKKEAFHLTGITLKKKTFNANGQSSIDCGSLWQEFENRNVAAHIPNRLGDEVYAVYYDYEGDHTKPYSYFIGCRIEENAQTPEGLNELFIPEAIYQYCESKGKMPDCVAQAWRQIWLSDIDRAYKYDFEIYDRRSRNWEHAEVDIFLSLKD